MKTTALTIIAIAVLAVGSVNFTKAATPKNEVSTTLKNVSNINKIEVHGNVQVYISDGTQDQVKVYNHYYAENALVQNQNGVLRISSYKAEKLVVWVTAADLRSISAYDNAVVTSFGKLAEIDLSVTLNDNALAQLDLNGYSANINVNGRAKANLSGNLAECELHYDRTSFVNQTNLTADHFVKQERNNILLAKNDNLVLADL